MRDNDVTFREIASPIGTLLLTGTRTHLTGLYMDAHLRGPKPAPGWRHDERAFAAAVEQLAAYFAGEVEQFDVPLSLEGTDFQRRVWAALAEIPFGATLTYGDVARQVGNPDASRAVGAAVGRNPISIIVPCHRVVGTGGQLTGFGGGLPRKRWLLEHEGSLAPGALTVERAAPATLLF
jgi:methylated-DNA-[protein]-cysteine S-methyltransferase